MSDIDYISKELLEYKNDITFLQNSQSDIKKEILKLQESVEKLYIKISASQHVKLKVIDLFCGCGGMSKGLTDAGLDVIAGIDYWEPAIKSYSKNYNHLAIHKDLTSYPPEEFDREYNIKLNHTIDIIVGGPPCQGFSLAGKRDNTDPRNSLFMEYVKYLNYFNPKAFIMENVLGILSMKTATNENVIDIIMAELNKNYNTLINKLYASDFEVPQKRRRVIIIGIHKDLSIYPTAPEPVISEASQIVVRNILLPRESISQSHFLTERAKSGILRKKEKSLKDGKGFGAQILNLDKPSYTIPARYWKDGYDALIKYDDGAIRRLSILELMRIQSFPDSYIIEGSRKDIIIQIGNAVACKFAYHLGKHLLNILQSSHFIN